jgi:ADP-heptose:LPS heptosyltransferase
MQAAQTYSRTKAARRILVVDLGFLGDTVHLVPALWEIQRGYPETELHVLTSSLGAEVLQLIRCVDRAWALEMHPETRSLRQQWQVLRKLRRLRFDLALNFSGADRSVFFTALSGARVKVAHESGRRQFWRRWLIAIWVLRQDKLLPVYEQRRQVLRACGIELGRPVWDLQIPGEAACRAESLVPANSIHFSINASSPLKEWPLGHWVELARELLSADPTLRIVATGSRGANEQERLRELIQCVANERLMGLPPGLSIAELAGVLQRCSLHVGADSGVLHLAIALGLRTVSLFRNYEDVSAWLPTGPKHRVLSVACECVNHPDGPCYSAGPAECLERIQPAQVAALIHEQLVASCHSNSTAISRSASSLSSSGGEGRGEAAL